ncbi:hypothetical protein BLNAU_24617 [Blattamonas nauphoetae]|uniref:Uncharacterized protein n=1 Tax=Blattamonas nauphoetae TaxID=2049346 RepID=A0ABQ9WMT3_9EUKA|nr:hypothetical protein BLNAU_24617 [Blattamonas nauphoetae]
MCGWKDQLLVEDHFGYGDEMRERRARRASDSLERGGIGKDEGVAGQQVYVSLEKHIGSILFQLSTSEKRMSAWEPLWMDLSPEIFLSVNNMTIHDITYIFLDLLEQLRVHTYHLVVTSHQQVLSFFSNSDQCNPSSFLPHALLDHSSFASTNLFFLLIATFLMHRLITLLRNYINAKIPVADAHFIPFCIFPSISPKNQFLDPDLLCSYNSTGMDASSQLQLRHAKVAKAGFLFTKIRRYSTKQTGQPPVYHTILTREDLVRYIRMLKNVFITISVHPPTHSGHPLFFQNQTDLLQNSISSSLFVVPLQEKRWRYSCQPADFAADSALREADEHAVALVAAVAVLSEPEQILVNTEELVKNWKQSTRDRADQTPTTPGNRDSSASPPAGSTTPSPHSPQRVSGRAGLVRCEECRWEGRKDFDPALPFDASLLSTRTTFAINYTKDHVFLMDMRGNLNPNPRLVIGSSNSSYDKATTLPDSEHQIITHHSVSTDDSNSEFTSLDGSSRTRTFQAADSIAFIQVSNCQFSDQTFSGSGVVFSNSGTFHVLRAFDSLFENNKAGTKGGCISTHYSDHTSTDASFGRTQPLKEAAHTTSISQT